MAAITYDAYSDQLTNVDSDDNLYLTEAEKGGRVRTVRAEFTAAASIADGSQIEMARIKGSRAISGSIDSSGRALLRAEVGYSLVSSATDDNDNVLLGGAGTPISIATAGTVALTPHDGTNLVGSIALPAGEVSLFVTVDNNGGAGLQSGDVIALDLQYVQ